MNELLFDSFPLSVVLVENIADVYVCATSAIDLFIRVLVFLSFSSSSSFPFPFISLLRRQRSIYNEQQYIHISNR